MKKLTDASIDRLAEAAWKVLWGLGPKKREWAIKHCAAQLFEQGFLISKDVEKNDALAELMAETIDAAVECDFLDQPSKGCIRAVIGNAEFYEPEDWDMCVVQAIGKKVVKRHNAISLAAVWAKKNVGLDFVELQTGSLIWEQLGEAIDRALKVGELERTSAGMLVKGTPKEEDPVDDETDAGLAEPFRKKRRIVTLFDVEKERQLSKPATTGYGGQTRESRSRRHTRKNVERWNEGYVNLLEFVRIEGHARVPKMYKDENRYPLGQWVAEQRKVRDVIPDERRTLLEGLPGWVWVVYNIKWDERYALLLRFSDRESHARVPETHLEEGFKLGQWVIDQRLFRDLLSVDRRKALEELPGWVWSSSS